VQVTDNANATASKQFALNISTGATLSSNGIANSASYTAGAVAAGEIVTIFGSFPGPRSTVTLQLDGRGYVSTNLAGMQVFFDGVASSIIYAASGQLSAIVPYSVVGRSFTQVQVWYQGQASNIVSLTVVGAAPGIFTSDASGRGQGAILNQDGTVNSANFPAPAGSYVSVFATGEGQTNPSGVDGKPGDSSPPQPIAQPITATIGGRDAQVVYAGGVSGLVAGVFQVNIQIPPETTPGSAIPLNIGVAGLSSQAGVTLAVK
jgi:uncharacterized protein (TIGR03437 family)